MPTPLARSAAARHIPTQVLSETDACLQALMRRLNSPAASQARPTGAAVADGASGAWAPLADRLAVDVAKQPKLLQGGELRSYQMQVRGC
jgi:hypothetical protein